MNEPTATVRLLRAASWCMAAVPLLYFIVLCGLAADGRSDVGASSADGEHALWCLWTKRFCAHIAEATFGPPTLWILTALFAQLPRGKFIAQAVLVTGGCSILIAFWSYASQMLLNGRVG